MTDAEILIDILRGCRALSAKDLKDAGEAIRRIEKQLENKSKNEQTS